MVVDTYSPPLPSRMSNPPSSSTAIAVPTGAYHKVAAAVAARIRSLAGRRVSNATLDRSQATPNTTNATFMPIDLGGIPTAATSRAQGPSRPAYGPLHGGT